MWTPDVLVRFLGTLDTGLPDGQAPRLVAAGPYIPPQPDRIVIATLLPGAGTLREDLFDQPAMQLYVRSDQNDLTGQSAARIAKAFDEALLFGQTANRTLTDDQGGYLGRVVAVQRAGGAPAPSGPPDSGHRVELTGTYVLQIATR